MSDRCTAVERTFLPKNHCSGGARNGGRYKCALGDFTGCLPSSSEGGSSAEGGEQNKNICLPNQGLQHPAWNFCFFIGSVYLSGACLSLCEQ